MAFEVEVFEVVEPSSHGGEETVFASSGESASAHNYIIVSLSAII